MATNTENRVHANQSINRPKGVISSPLLRDEVPSKTLLLDRRISLLVFTEKSEIVPVQICFGCKERYSEFFVKSLGLACLKFTLAFLVWICIV